MSDTQIKNEMLDKGNLIPTQDEKTLLGEARARALGSNIITIDSDYTTAESERDKTIFLNASTFILDRSSLTNGWTATIINKTNGPITINYNSETVPNETKTTLNSFKSLVVILEGTNFWLFGELA